MYIIMNYGVVKMQITSTDKQEWRGAYLSRVIGEDLSWGGGI